MTKGYWFHLDTGPVASGTVYPVRRPGLLKATAAVQLRIGLHLAGLKVIDDSGLAYVTYPMDITGHLPLIAPTDTTLRQAIEQAVLDVYHKSIAK